MLKNFFFALIFLPVLCFGQGSTFILNSDPIDIPKNTAFKDTVEMYCIFISDSLTGETQSRVLKCERYGTLVTYVADATPNYGYPGQTMILTPSIYSTTVRTHRDVKTRRFYYVQGSQTVEVPQNIILLAVERGAMANAPVFLFEQ